MTKLLCIILFPALELYLLVQAGKYIGGLGVVCMVVASMFLGGWVVQHRGVQALANARQELRADHMPHEALLGDLLTLLAGVLLIFPGFLSDIAGLLLLIPPVRAFCASRLLTYFTKRQQAGQTGFQGVFIYRSGRNFSEQTPGQKTAEKTIIDCVAEPVDAARDSSGAVNDTAFEERK
jgi:UPF0716 protein FxsA